MPRFSRMQWFWIVVFLIVLLFILAPQAGLTQFVRQFIHQALGVLQSFVDKI